MAGKSFFVRRHKHEWDFLGYYSGGGKIYHCLYPGCRKIKWGIIIFTR